MFKIKDRVKESSITEGNPLKIVLNDTYGGFQSFSDAIGSGNSTFYTIENNANYEIGIGTYDSADNSISRDIILESSNNDGRITLLGVSVVFGTYPGTHAFFLNDQGFASGQAPYYSGVAFPDGRVQNVAYQGSGELGHITFWNGTHSFDSNHYLVWDNPTSTLIVSGIARFDSDVYISGNFEVAGTQTIVNTEINNSAVSGTTLTQSTFRIDDAAGCFFHAYVDNDDDNMVALYSTNEATPTWRLGLKDYSSSFVGAPSRGFVFGDRDSIGGVADNITDNLYVLNASNGFWVKHVGRDILNVDRNNGLTLYNDSPVVTPLNIIGAAGQSSSLQSWNQYSGSTVATMSNSGRLKINSVEYPDGSVQTTASTSLQLRTRDYKTISSNYLITEDDDVILINSSASPITITLPEALTLPGYTFTFKKISGTNSITINADPDNLIDGESSISINYNNETYSIFSNSNNWYIL